MTITFTGGYRDDRKKLGRWSSDTFLMYIHNQIAEYSEGWIEKMASTCSFFNLEGVFAEC